MEENQSKADEIFEKIAEKIKLRKNPKGCMSIDCDTVYFGEEELNQVLEEMNL
jgi:hypothetical protein